MKHWLSYRQRQPQKPGGRARDIGKIWHSMMQDWFSQIQERDFPDADTIVTKYLNWQPASEEDSDVLSTLLWMWDGFLVNGDPFVAWTVYGVEKEYLTPLPPIPGQPKHVTIVLKSIIDLILRKQTRWAIVDHKSQGQKSDPDTLTRDMDMDDQLSMYLATIFIHEGVAAHKMSAIWNYAVTKDLKKTPRPPEDRFWLSYSARSEQELRRAMAEFSESVLDAYARPAVQEPPRHPDKENCRWRCDHRSICFYARQSDRPVQLEPPQRLDQVPLGLARNYKGRINEYAHAYQTSGQTRAAANAAAPNEGNDEGATAPVHAG